ncbi:hypothetical protein AAC387_Pa09g0465 [Persea americana]
MMRFQQVKPSIIASLINNLSNEHHCQGSHCNCFQAHPHHSSAGYEAPNLRKLADKVAAAGFYVVVPDFFYGNHFLYGDPENLVPVWMKSHGTDKGYEDAKAIIEDLKSKGTYAIGAAGFCWGEVKSPISILAAELDKYCPLELVKQFEDILSGKPEVDSFVKIFPGAGHGWTVRYNLDDEAAVNLAEESHQDMLAWFTKHVK